MTFTATGLLLATLYALLVLPTLGAHAWTPTTTLNEVLQTPPPLPWAHGVTIADIHQRNPSLHRRQDDDSQGGSTTEQTPVDGQDGGGGALGQGGAGDLGLPEAEGGGMEVITVTVTPIVTVDPVQETVTVTTSHRLTPATTPIPLADTMGMIMPNPWSHMYTELEYTFGFVDPVPRPAPTAGAWLRVVQPLLIFPNYTVAVFPSYGTDDPTSVDAIPVGSDGLCGATAANWPLAFPFKFLVPGWYMYVVNQTYMRVNVTSNNQCTHPILSQRSFFATQSFSIDTIPTISPPPRAPTSAYTVFGSVSTELPGDLPIDPHVASKGEKLTIALGVTGAVLGIALIIGIMWWVRKKRKMEREALAFSRLPLKDQESFLRDNPDSFLNPNHPRYTAKNGYAATGPPAPPGTMAYAIWWSQQMWNNQLMRQHPLGWNAYQGAGAYQPAPQMRAMPPPPHQAGWAQQGYGTQPRAQVPAYGGAMYQYGR